MTKNELYEKLVEDELQEDISRFSSHAPWLAQFVISLPKDPGYKKLSAATKEEIERIIAAIE